MVVEDSNDSPSLMIVLSGTVELSQKNFDTGVPTKIHKAHVAGVLCQLQTLTNEPSFFTVKAIAKDTKVSLICFFIDFFLLVLRKVFLNTFYPHFTIRIGCEARLEICETLHGT